MNDRAEVGVIYAGTPDIIKRMTIERSNEDFDQVYSRIGYTCNLANRFTQNEISTLFSEFELDNTIIKYLCKAASKKGGLRYIVNLFKVAASKSRKAVTVANLEAAAKAAETAEIGIEKARLADEVKHAALNDVRRNTVYELIPWCIEMKGDLYRQAEQLTE